MSASSALSNTFLIEHIACLYVYFALQNNLFYYLRLYPSGEYIKESLGLENELTRLWENSPIQLHP